jgi:hypothetical protein
MVLKQSTTVKENALNSPERLGVPKHMAKIVLVGTSHKYQTRGLGLDATYAEQFEHLLISLCSEYMIKGIAEEMNQAALAERNITETVAQAVSAALEIKHQLSDPPPQIRQKLGVRGENDIRAYGWLQNWSPERIETEVRQSHEIRERYWLTQLHILNSWPLLFVCGANHSAHFSELLQKEGFDVVVEFSDWVPNPSNPQDCARSRAVL